MYNKKEISKEIKEDAQKSISEMKFDIDFEYCKRHNIKFKPHGDEGICEEDLPHPSIDLFNSKSNRAVLDFVFRLP